MSGSSMICAFDKAAEANKHSEKPKTPPPFSIRFTDQERSRLDREAGNRPLSVHIRDKLFGEVAAPRKGARRRPHINDVMLAKALSDLGRSRLASNMNQLARASNTGRLRLKPEAEAELIRACADIAAMRRELMTALGLKAE